jgi:hypothetical protein
MTQSQNFKVLRFFMGLSALIAVSDGVVMTIDPVSMLSMHGMTSPGSDAIGLARMLAVTNIGFGLLNVFAIKAGPSLALWAIVLADALTDTMSLCVALFELFNSGMLDPMGWTTVILFAMFASGFWYAFMTLNLKGSLCTDTPPKKF